MDTQHSDMNQDLDQRDRDRCLDQDEESKSVNTSSTEDGSDSNDGSESEASSSEQTTPAKASAPITKKMVDETYEIFDDTFGSLVDQFVSDGISVRKAKQRAHRNLVPKY